MHLSFFIVKGDPLLTSEDFLCSMIHLIEDALIESARILDDRERELGRSREAMPVNVSQSVISD